jgi:hypothetical protein
VYTPVGSPIASVLNHSKNSTNLVVHDKIIFASDFFTHSWRLSENTEIPNFNLY